MSNKTAQQFVFLEIQVNQNIFYIGWGIQ